MSNFNASITLTELLMKTLENCAKDLASRCIIECGSRHGFNATEEIRVLGLENLSLIRKQMSKRSSVSKVRKEKNIGERKKSSLPLPFVAENVEINGCQGLAYNRGLFTQCSKKCMENGKFCNGCQTEADKNASGCPDCGTVESRLGTGLYEFKDPKGRSPVPYVKVLEKLKVSIDVAMEEAGKKNIEINEEHFVVVEKSKGSKKSKVSVSARGRPKKQGGAIEAENVTDLFAKLTSESEEEMIEDFEEDLVKPKKSKLSEEDRAAKKAALEEERIAKKLEREAKIAAEKEERQAKIAAEKEEREAKRKADAEQKKQEREAKIAAEKEEREAKRALEKQEREAKRKEEAEQKKKVSKKPVVVAVAPVVAPVVAAAPAKVTVTRIQIGGKQYLKSSNNILYDPNTKEEVGLWDPDTKTIKELPEEDEEEVEEEDYDSN